MVAQTECRKAGLKMNKYAGSPSTCPAKPLRLGRNVLSVSLLWCVLPMPLYGLRRSALRVAGPAGADACFGTGGGAGKRVEATARPERAVRSGAAYFAASTRVLCGKYSSTLREVLEYSPQRTIRTGACSFSFSRPCGRRKMDAGKKFFPSLFAFFRRKH